MIFNFPIAGMISIIEYQDKWNNMVVDWATNVINSNSLQKGVVTIKYCDGYLIPRVIGIKDKQALAFDGRRIAMTKEDIEALSETGIITILELKALLRGKEISTVINPK